MLGFMIIMFLFLKFGDKTAVVCDFIPDEDDL